MSITERWQVNYEYLLVNFVFQERGKSYLVWLYVSNGEQISSTQEARRSPPTRIAISRAPLAAPAAAEASLESYTASKIPSLGNSLSR